MAHSLSAAGALEGLIASGLPIASSLTAAFVPSLLAGREGVLAVVLYGSRLALGARDDSEPDFYVVVDSHRRFHRRLRDAALGLGLPPSTYHLRIDGERRCKLSVVSASQLERETSLGAADLHHLGRFSKRLGLAWARDRAAAALVARARLSSLRTLAGHALALVGERFGLDELLLTLLGLSYRGEVRVEGEDRVRALFDDNREHYRAVGALLLDERAEVVREAAAGRYRQPPPTGAARAVTLALIARSRRRELLRWPKYLLTFEGWLDYAVRKVERHTGRAVGLSERGRRHPLVFGWPALLALHREGLVR